MENKISLRTLDKEFSPEDYKALLDPAVRDMSVLRTIPEAYPKSGIAWCLVLQVPVQAGDSTKLYLYLSRSDSSHVFSQLTDNEFKEVVFWDKRSCLKTLDYIRSKRAEVSPMAPGIIRAYNPYTNQLI